MGTSPYSFVESLRRPQSVHQLNILNAGRSHGDGGVRKSSNKVIAYYGKDTLSYVGYRLSVSDLGTVIIPLNSGLPVLDTMDITCGV